MPFTDQFAHLLVDEAQDISPIEWNILEQHLRPGGHWTLVGDQNQRRSSATYASWTDISDHLGLGDGDEPLRPRCCGAATGQPRPSCSSLTSCCRRLQRGATSVQVEGPKPRVEYVAGGRIAVPEGTRVGAAADRPTRTERSRSSLSTRPDDPMLGQQGWRRGETLNVWARDGEVLRVFVPEAARGLEFDGVVVVEPGAAGEPGPRRTAVHQPDPSEP